MRGELPHTQPITYPSTRTWAHILYFLSLWMNCPWSYLWPTLPHVHQIPLPLLSLIIPFLLHHYLSPLYWTIPISIHRYICNFSHLTNKTTLLIPNSPSTIIPFLSSHPQQSYLRQLSQIVLLFSLKPTSIRLSLHRSTKLLSSGSPIIGELLNPMVLSHFLPCLISLPHSTPVISPISLKLSVGHNTLQFYSLIAPSWSMLLATPIFSMVKC